MKCVLSSSIILFLTVTAFSQERVSGKFDNEPVVDVIVYLEDATGYQFYYSSDWVDSLTVTSSFENVPLAEALTGIFRETTIGYFLYEDKVILTNNVVIIENPEITRAFLRDSGEVRAIEKGLVFSREYFDQSEGQTHIENMVFEIGTRNKMVPGGKSSIAGFVRDAETNEPVEGALVYVQEPFSASSTNSEGFYSLTLPNGKHQLFTQFVGMKTTYRNVALFSDGRFDINMQVDIIALQEVLVESDRDINVSNVQMGVSRLNIEESKNVPIVLGEKDIMKVATTLAGVQTVGEGASGINVRGGKADQNLIMVNNAPIYNASHFFGFFSVFNSEAVESMEIYKSGIPAKYGGRLSSVFDIQSKSANKKEFKGEGGISPITGRLTLEVPISEDKASLLVSGRTTYTNWLLKRVNNAEFNGNEVSFYDLTAQLDVDIDSKNNITASAYYSKDKFQMASDTLFAFSDFEYINSNATLKWRHQFNNNFDARLSAIYSGYQYDLSFDESPPNAFIQDFGINEKSVDLELNYFLGERHTFNFGGGIKHYTINPGTKSGMGLVSIVAPQTVAEEQGMESNLFFSDQFDVSDNFSIYGGVRYTMFNVLGPAQVYSYQEGSPVNSSTVDDSTSYGQGEVIQTYQGPEARISGRYKINEQSSIKFSYNRTRQYIHSLSNSASFSPTDTWRLSSAHLKPQIADQYSIGYYRNFFRNKLETSVETYFKEIENLVDFKTGSDFLLNQQIEREMLQGPGRSYGIEFSIQKKGRLNGWVNYTYARTLIQLDGEFAEEIVNDGNYFPTAYDKPHTVNLVGNYKLTRRFSTSINMTYNTGRPVTIPVAVYDLLGSESFHFSDRNEYRIPDYFRIDVGLNLEGNHKKNKLSHSFWSLSVYNLLGRDNPYSVFFEVKDGVARGYQLIVFGNPIPTLSYNFKF